MKFNQYNTNSLYVEAFNKQDKVRFFRAFNPKKVTKTVDGEKVTKIEPFFEDREWVMEVLTLFAESLALPMNQVIQSFKSGDIQALRRAAMCHHNRLISIKVKDSDHPTSEEIEVMKKTSHFGKLGAMEPTDFQNFIRSKWSWCLSLRGPGDKIARMKMADLSDEAQKTAA